MSERYSRLFSLSENLYATGSPILIVAGALLKDNQTGKVLAQLKMRNIGAKPIKAATISIQPLDTVGNLLGSAVSHQYLDLNVSRNDEFGAKTPVMLPDASTRSYFVSVTEVIFTDNTTWKSSNEPWEVLSFAVTLDEALKDSELVKQYRIQFGTESKYKPTVQKDLWHCACGELNRKEEATCCRCGKSLAALQAIDISVLKADRDARIASEKKKAAEDKAAAESKAKKTKKTAMIVVPIICAVIALVAILNLVIIPNAKYSKAIKLMDAGMYEEAIAAFNALDGYKDSAEQIVIAESALNEIACEKKYNDAIALMDAEMYEDAISTFDALGGYKDSIDMITACNTAILDGQYNDAVALMEAGKFYEATNAFLELDDYRDSFEKANYCFEEYKTELLISANVGDYVIFGAYEQDNASNGWEAVEWLVLEKQGDQILVVSKYALDNQAYNTSNTDTTWENCSLREWLNNDFLNVAFSDSEKKMIPMVTLPADDTVYKSDPGNDTQDQVFLLSLSEVEKYLTSDESRKCMPTDYAIANGAYAASDSGYSCWWWVRTPGMKQNYAASIHKYGLLNETGDPANTVGIAVRPALWIDLNS